EDGSVTIFTSHVDIGTGIGTVYRQVAAEELGIPVERVTIVEGDTARTPSHGGTGGGSGGPGGAVEIRRGGATARVALLGLASKELGAPLSSLTIADGQVRGPGAGAGVTIGRLMGGKRFEIPIDPNVPLKDPASYTVVGKPILRHDLPGKASG